MCNFELSPEAFAQRRVEMIALADERRLARALRPVRATRVRTRRNARIALAGPARLTPSPAPRPVLLVE